jgi:hypothetical protein
MNSCVTYKMSVSSKPVRAGDPKLRLVLKKVSMQENLRRKRMAQQGEKCVLTQKY